MQIYRSALPLEPTGSGGGKGAKGGGIRPRRHFPGGGISKNIKKIRRLNVLQLSISVHQRCSVTFKKHQIHFRIGSTHAWELPTLPSRLGPRARRGPRLPRVLTGALRPPDSLVCPLFRWVTLAGNPNLTTH